MIYLIGSLRNPKIPLLANRLEAAGYEVFADWYGAGETADDSWQAYETIRGHSYLDALNGYAARHIFEFDLTHLMRADTVVLLTPAGTSGHLEFGWAIGAGKRGFILLHEIPRRWDVMRCFAHGVFLHESDLLSALHRDHSVSRHHSNST